MPCLDDSTIAAFVDGRLAPIEQAAAEAHVSACGECAELLATVGRATPPFGDADTVPMAPTAGADEALLDALGLLREGAGSPERPRCFAPGDEIAGRYRVVRFIARGGMGEVYEVDDGVLGTRVALKTVRAAIAGDARALERFRSELLLARKVTHPNVCRLFDVGFHVAVPAPGDGRPAQIVFLTMELLAGETLGLRVRREGRLTSDEAWPILQQIGAALAAAHAAGVVHRDLKSDNVLLVPADDRPGDGLPRSPLRAVVTDFGLARVIASDPPSRGGPAFSGTPAYMAPEQVAGEAVTASADLYAFGVVLYETLTGQLPFSGRSATEIAERRLVDRPLPLRHHVAGVDPALERIAERCLEREPMARIPSAAALVEALDGCGPASRLARRRRGAAVAAGLLLVTAAAIALPGWLARRSSLRPSGAPSSQPAVATSAQRTSVVLLGFADAAPSADSGWLASALADLVDRELVAGNRLRTVSREEVALLRGELGLAEGSPPSPAILATLRARTGAEALILGRYVARPGGTLAVDVELLDAMSGRRTLAIHEEGSIAELAPLALRLGDRLRAALGAGDLSPSDQAEARAALPNLAAAPLYEEGLSKLGRFDAMAARDLLAKAVAANPSSPLAHAALAEAWARLGDDRQARAEASRAAGLAGDLPRDERLGVKATVDEILGHFDEEVSERQALWLFFPDDVELGVALAEAQIRAGHAADALATIEALHRLPRLTTSDPRVDLAEAHAAGALSDLPREEESAARAAQEARGEGAALFVAEARLAEGAALRDEGRSGEAAAAFEDAHDRFAAGGDRAGEAVALDRLAGVLATQGDLAAARRRYEEAETLCRALGAIGRAAPILAHEAALLVDTGDLAGARQRLAQALAIAREGGDRRAEAAVLETLALAEERQGDLAAARSTDEQAIAIEQSIGDQAGLAHALASLGRLLFRAGDLAGAERADQEAAALADAVSDARHATEARRRLAAIAADEDRLSDARALAVEARAIAKGGGLRDGVAAADLVLADVALDAQRPALAESAAREAVLEDRAISAIDEEARALGRLSQALLTEGQVAEASATLRQALGLAAGTSDVTLRVELALVAARIAAAEGNPEESRRQIALVALPASAAGLVGQTLALRLLQAELDAGRLAIAGSASAPSSPSPAVASELATVAADGRALGFLRVAREAAGGAAPTIPDESGASSRPARSSPRWPRRRSTRRRRAPACRSPRPRRRA